VNAARLTLVSLVYAVPAILLIGGGIISGLIAALLACGIAIVAATLRPGEGDFLLSLMRPVAVTALIPALWMLAQILPVDALGLAHPIWQSAEQALGYPIGGSISIDPGATLVALGQYLCVIAVGVLTVAVGLDRDRAESVLFALVFATAAIAAIVIAHDAAGLTWLDAQSAARAQAKVCIALGVFVAGAALIRTIERYETGRARPERNPAILLRTFIACSAALALCLIALGLDATAGLWFATAYGVATILAIVAIRRLGLGPWENIGIATVAGLVAAVTIGIQLAARPIDLTLAFASKASDALLSTTQRILADAPWTGTGAGTFDAILPIYRDAGDAVGSTPPTAAAAIAIELGRPMLLLIISITGGGIVQFLRGALRRGRDSFYPAAGTASLVFILLWAFCDMGPLSMPTGICVAATVGLALAQCRSRAVN
jgi:hypothetical protein